MSRPRNNQLSTYTSRTRDRCSVKNSPPTGPTPNRTCHYRLSAVQRILPPRHMKRSPSWHARICKIVIWWVIIYVSWDDFDCDHMDDLQFFHIRYPSWGGTLGIAGTMGFEATSSRRWAEPITDASVHLDGDTVNTFGGNMGWILQKHHFHDFGDCHVMAGD